MTDRLIKKCPLLRVSSVALIIRFFSTSSFLLQNLVPVHALGLSTDASLFGSAENSASRSGASGGSRATTTTREDTLSEVGRASSLAVVGVKHEVPKQASFAPRVAGVSKKVGLLAGAIAIKRKTSNRIGRVREVLSRLRAREVLSRLKDRLNALPHRERMLYCIGPYMVGVQTAFSLLSVGCPCLFDSYGWAAALDFKLCASLCGSAYLASYHDSEDWIRIVEKLSVCSVFEGFSYASFRTPFC